MPTLLCGWDIEELHLRRINSRKLNLRRSPLSCTSRSRDCFSTETSLLSWNVAAISQNETLVDVFKRSPADFILLSKFHLLLDKHWISLNVLDHAMWRLLASRRSTWKRFSRQFSEHRADIRENELMPDCTAFYCGMGLNLEGTFLLTESEIRFGTCPGKERLRIFKIEYNFYFYTNL